MTSVWYKNDCDKAGLVCAYAMQTLSIAESETIEAHLTACAACKQEFEALGPIIASFSSSWPTDVLRPGTRLQDRLARRIAAQAGGASIVPRTRPWIEPEWLEVGPGISVKILANDEVRHIVSMLVRLAPNTEYPSHIHAGVEELHLLDGELWIDDRKLYAGDYNRAEPGTCDRRVWSETGCACVLITSTRDVLT